MYVLSDDIWRKRAPQELRRQILFLGPEEEASVNLPPAVKVRTFKSTDEGVAFMVECEGKRIYHAGDLNNWVWRGEPEADNARMSDRYHRELDEMAGNHVDVAFVPLDPRQEEDFYRGMDDYMRTVGCLLYTSRPRGASGGWVCCTRNCFVLHMRWSTTPCLARSSGDCFS